MERWAQCDVKRVWASSPPELLTPKISPRSLPFSVTISTPSSQFYTSHNLTTVSCLWTHSLKNPDPNISLTNHSVFSVFSLFLSARVLVPSLPAQMARLSYNRPPAFLSLHCAHPAHPSPPSAPVLKWLATLAALAWDLQLFNFCGALLLPSSPTSFPLSVPFTCLFHTFLT